MERKSTGPGVDRRGSERRCERCFLPAHLCLCAELPRVETRTRLLILRHVRETWKRSNTAGLASLALPNSRLVTYSAPGETFDPSILREPDTWLLFPEGPPPPEGAPPPKSLVVLDGSWAQVRRMTQRLPELRALPRLVLPAPAPATLRLRTPTHPAGMSTLEAIASALELLEGPAVAEPLRKLHALRVQRILEAGSPVGTWGAKGR